jgi:hypothetical protein
LRTSAPWLSRPSVSWRSGACKRVWRQAMQLAMDTQRKDLGEPDQRVEVGGPDGEAIAVRVIYDDEPSVGFGGRNGWSA